MKPTWTVLPSTITCLLYVAVAQADFVGLNIGTSQWQSGLSGGYNSSRSAGFDPIDERVEPNYTNPPMLIILEHPIAALPNMRYQGHALDSSSSRVLTSDLVFNGQPFASGDQINTTFNLSHDDIVFYYELLNGKINLDLGVDLKRLSGEVELNGISSTRILVEETIPLLYLSARYDLPYRGFYIGADTNNFNMSGSYVQDSTVRLGYQTRNGLGLEGGVKSFSLKLDDVNSLDTDIKYDGLFLNGYFNF